MAQDPHPLLVVTVLMDASARSANVTRSHGDAMERAMTAAAGQGIAGFELVELAIAPKAFAALRRELTMPPTTVAVYDLFPLSAALDPALRVIAGQFLAAEALWTMEEQGILGGASPGERLSLPRGWSKDPRDIRQRLLDAGATQLTEEGIKAYNTIKQAWDKSAPRA